MCVYLSAVSVWDLIFGLSCTQEGEVWQRWHFFSPKCVCVYVNVNALLGLYIECKLSTLSC